jgi:anion-transporting  ArsA/GET3 family ATPase
MVTIPEALAVQQLDAVLSELAKFGLIVRQLIVNNVVSAPDSEFLMARAKEQSKYLKQIHDKFGYMKITELPMFPYELKGLKRLKEAEDALFQ